MRWTPIPMDLPSHNPTLQTLIAGWGHQHYTHALATETPLFTIQIKRYGFREGQSYKISTPIALRPNAVVDVPIFCTGAGTETYSAQYRLVFAVVHTGSTPNAGHYQTALSSGSRFLLSDDRIAPKPLKQQDYVWVAQNCYLLGLLRHV